MFKRGLMARLYRDGEPVDSGSSAPASDAGMADVQTNWGDMASDSDSDSSVVTAPETSVVAPVTTPVATPAAPAAAPSVAAEPNAQPQPVQTQPVQSDIAASPAQPAPVQQTPEQIAVLRQNYATELERFYQIDPQLAQQLQTQPEAVLPKLAAQVHLEVLDAIAAQIPQRVGRIVNQILESRAAEEASQAEFFKPFPDLVAHKEAVLNVGRLYRAANPTAPKEVAIKAIGDFVRQSLGLQPPAPTGQNTATPPVVNPFTPAGGSGNGAPPAPKSLWDEMASDGF